MAATILTPADLATELGTDPRTARRFLRSITPRDDQPGKGARWAIEKKQVRSLRTKFAKFRADEDAKRAEREANRAETAPAIDSTDDDGAIDEMLDTDDEPTAEALAEIESE